MFTVSKFLKVQIFLWIIADIFNLAPLEAIDNIAGYFGAIIFADSLEK
jgi:hypothetical protein